MFGLFRGCLLYTSQGHNQKPLVHIRQYSFGYFVTKSELESNPLLSVLRLPKTHVWGGFVQFRCSTSPIPKTSVRVQTKHEFLHFFVFRNEHAQSTTLDKTSCLGGFALFRCRTTPIPKTSVGVHTSTSFCHRNYLFVFRPSAAQGCPAAARARGADNSG